MGNVKPISFDEAVKQGKVMRENVIPDEMIEAVNELLVEKLAIDSKPIIILRQDTIIDRYLSKVEKNHLIKNTRQEMFEKGYLNFESLFQKAGWLVTYDKPGYNEDYPNTFQFKQLEKH